MHDELSEMFDRLSPAQQNELIRWAQEVRVQTMLQRLQDAQHPALDGSGDRAWPPLRQDVRGERWCTN